MVRILNYTITQPNQSVGSFLKSKGYSRNVLAHLKQTRDGICRNGSHAYTNLPLAAGDVLTIRLVDEAPSQCILPCPLPLSIVYEDDDILVLDKAADMPVHPSINNFDNTLANGLAYYFQQKKQDFVYRCINRLDRDTTGLLIVAKHMLSAHILSKMLTNRQIKRRYLAVCNGEASLSDTISAPIGRKDDSVIERMVDFERGDVAITHYQRLAYENGHSLLLLTLETGRTHQIRVHMHYNKTPIIGDFLYNPDYALMGRQGLHSAFLGFFHPITGEEMTFFSPLPPDMAKIFSFQVEKNMIN